MTKIRHSNSEQPGDTARLLQMLRKRIRYLMQEVKRLREENSSMADRLEELEERVTHEGTLLMLEEDPNALREQINNYIQLIDEQLGTD